MNRVVSVVGVALLAALVAFTVGWYFLHETSTQTPPLDTPPPAVPAVAEANAAQHPLEDTAPEPGSEPPFVPEAGGIVVREVEEAAPGAIRFYGVVLDATTDAPIPNATVALALSHENLGETQTDGTGAFSLTCAEPFDTDSLGDDLALVCRADGYAHVEKAVADLVEERTDAVRVDFFLRPGAGVSGRVFDAATGAGIAGVDVVLISTTASFMESIGQRARHGADATTGDDGAYAITHAKPGSYRVVVQARDRGYVLRPEAAVTVTIDEGRPRESVDFALELGAVVTGRVRNAHGAPVSGATVSVRPAQLVEKVMQDFDAIVEMESLTDTSADDGRYEIVGLDFDSDYRVGADADDYAEALSDVFRVEPGRSPAQRDLVVSKGSIIAGWARYEDGSPASQRKLTLFPDLGGIISGAFVEPKQATTDERGAFEFKAVPAGEFTIRGRLGPAAFMPFGQAEEPVTVEPDGIHDLLGVEVSVHCREWEEEGRPLAQGVIDGVVLRASGVAAGGVRVQAQDSTNPRITAGTFARGNGTFTLKNLRGDYFDVFVTSEEGEGRVERVAVGSRTTIRLAPPTRVSGRVVDQAGDGVPGCSVRLQAQGDEAGPSPADFDPQQLMGSLFGLESGGETTGEDGFFEFKIVAPGSYTIAAKSAEKGTGESGVIVVHAGRETSGLRIVLSPGVSFAGEVRDSRGTPIEGCTVSLKAMKPGSFAGMMQQFMPDMMQTKAGSAASDAAGRFTIANVASGNYVVNATHPGYAKTTHKDVAVEAGRDVTGYRITLLAGGCARGHVLFGGEPRAGMMVQIMGDGGMEITSTDGEGRFEVCGLSPGSYLLQAMDMSGLASGDLSAAMPQQVTVEIRDGEDTEVSFVPPPGSVPVTGVIEGEPGATIFVSLRREGGMAPEDFDFSNMDMATLPDQVRYQAGQAVVDSDGSFQMEGVLPGTYILEVTSIDFEAMGVHPGAFDLQAMMESSRIPVLRREVTVEPGKPLDLQLDLPPAE